MRRVDRQHRNRVLMMLVFLHVPGTDLFPEILAPVLGRAVPESCISERDPYTWFSFSGSNTIHPPSPPSTCRNSPPLPFTPVNRVPLSCAPPPKILPFVRRHVDVVEHRIHQPANAEFPAFSQIVTHHDAAIVGRADPSPPGKTIACWSECAYSDARGRIPPAGAPPRGPAVAADVYVVQPADHRIGIVRMHRDRVVVRALPFGRECVPPTSCQRSPPLRLRYTPSTSLPSRLETSAYTVSGCERDMSRLMRPVLSPGGNPPCTCLHAPSSPPRQMPVCAPASSSPASRRPRDAQPVNDTSNCAAMASSGVPSSCLRPANGTNRRDETHPASLAQVQHRGRGH